MTSYSKGGKIQENCDICLEIWNELRKYLDIRSLRATSCCCCFLEWCYLPDGPTLWLLSSYLMVVYSLKMRCPFAHAPLHKGMHNLEAVTTVFVIIHLDRWSVPSTERASLAWLVLYSAVQKASVKSGRCTVINTERSPLRPTLHMF